MAEVLANMLVTDAQLAGILDVSARRVRQLAEVGTLERASPGRFELGASVRALLEHAAGNGSQLQRERTRKLKADADLAELELARRRGEVALISEFEQVQTARAAILQANVMNVPQRAVLRLLGEHSETTFKQTLREELMLALRTAAEAKIEISYDDENDDDASRP